MVDASLLEETLSHIRDNPELHDQSYCYSVNEFGLVACFAGRSLLLRGYDADLPMNLGACGSMATRPETNHRVGVLGEAQEILGLDHHWAVNLFTPLNTRNMLERKVKDLLSGSSMDTYYELLSVRS